ncbi:MFS transporter [Paraburkholderia sp. BL6669N2]|uniref:MFS transporter n=1 Tax=Paraburkholderia sp. BL6669N2 TaxID=1938807 RepID=UPI000E271BE5|nr:MFS transporter [Paraburkholderia sp. BL6669N2]REG49114.1 MFS transporter [Paraburkholderia sp. BL6669N2]
MLGLVSIGNFPYEQSSASLRSRWDFQLRLKIAASIDFANRSNYKPVLDVVNRFEHASYIRLLQVLKEEVNMQTADKVATRTRAHAYGSSDVADQSTGTAHFAILMVVVAMALRPGIASIGPVLPLISREFSLSHAMASLLATVPIMMLGLLAMPATWLAARYGTNEVLLVSLVTLFISMAVRPFTSNIAALLLTTIGVGAGIAVAGTLFGGMIKSRFPNRLAVMMSLFVMSLALSSALSAAATGPVAEWAGTNGWRVGTGVWAIVALIAVLAGLAIFRRETRTNRRPVANAANVAKPARAAPLPVINRKAWLIALFLACDNFLFLSDRLF